MSAVLSPVFGAGAQLFNNQGVVLAGGRLLTYLAGTTSLYPTWTASTQLTPNANPIILDSAGRVPNELWLANGTAYKFVLQDAASATLGTYDYIPGINSTNAVLTEWSTGLNATFVSGTSFTVLGNVVGIYQPLRRIQYSLTGGTYYGTIATSVYNGSTITTVTFTADSTVMDSSVGVVNYGFMSAVNPSIPSIFVVANSPVLTGTPVSTTAAPGTNTTQIATTAFVEGELTTYALKASPTLTGTPLAPTAAVGTNTPQIATMAALLNQAFSTVLPAQSAGTAGLFPQSQGASGIVTWASAGAGQGGTTSTASITLTAASPAAMTVTPATPGLYVTLPDATTCTKADNLYAVYNAGDYDYGVKDSTGTQLGWVRSRTGAMIGLSDSSTAAGVWAYYGLEKTGITASYVNATLANMGSTIRRIALDANRTCFLFGGTYCYAIVYDASTQTWGSATLVKATIVTGCFHGVLSAANQVLVTYALASGATFSAVTLTISGTGITVNTPVTVTPTYTITSMLGQFIPVGSSFVLAYLNGGQASIRAFTVSGTVPSLATNETTVYAGGVAPVIFASGSVVRTVSLTSTTNIAATPYTVSGTGFTVGTAANATCSGSSALRAFLNGNGNIVCEYTNILTHYATIFKLTGTVEAASSVSLGTATTSILSCNDYGVISASKTLFIGIVSGVTWYANILTDTAGTASAGTEISGTLQGSLLSGIPAFNITGTTAYVAAQSLTQLSVLTLNCSGTSPVLSNVISLLGSQSVANPYFKSSDLYGIKAPTQLYAGNYGVVIGGFFVDPSSSVSVGDVRVSQNSIARVTPLPIAQPFSISTGVTVSNTESWLNGTYYGSDSGQVIQRVEAAA